LVNTDQQHTCGHDRPTHRIDQVSLSFSACDRMFFLVLGRLREQVHGEDDKDDEEQGRENQMKVSDHLIPDGRIIVGSGRKEGNPHGEYTAQNTGDGVREAVSPV